MTVYNPKYESLLRKAGVEYSQLDGSLRDLIDKFERAYEAVKVESQQGQSELLKILSGVDAVICSRLYQLYRVTPGVQDQAEIKTLKIDKARAMALKAKALQMKWRKS